MKISYVIGTHNEDPSYLKPLIESIYNKESFIQDLDEILVIDDYSTNKETQDILDIYNSNKKITLFKHALNNNFE